MKEGAPRKVGIWSRVRPWLIRALLAVAALVVARVAWHLVYTESARAVIDGRAEAPMVARRNYLAAHLDDFGASGAPGGAQFSGEWGLVTLSMTAAACGNLGFEYPGTLKDDLRLARRAEELARKKEARAFDTDRWKEDALEGLDGDEAHIGYLGHLAIILEAYRLLGGDDAGALALEERVSRALLRRVQNAKNPMLPTYPGETYVADNAVVWAALALADVGRPPRSKAVLERVVRWARVHLVDSSTGLLQFASDDAGDGTGGARASGAAWSTFYLYFVDETFAKEQAQALHDHYVKHLFPGALAICETPACAGSGDVDSGPLVMGASPAASGFALAAAKRLGDENFLGGLLSTAEWAGLTLQWDGERRYVLAPLVGNAVVLAMETSRAWDARYLPGH